MIEIERKFLVKSTEYKKKAFQKTILIQGYLNSDPERTVRVRISGDKAFLTIKGKSSASGLTRFEWEKEIPAVEARELIHLCEPGIIEKWRYLVKQGDWIFEVDEFLGENEGLTIAEIELQSEQELFTLPPWLGQEVSGELKYYNSNLSKNPFNTWKKE